MKGNSALSPSLPDWNWKREAFLSDRPQLDFCTKRALIVTASVLLLFCVLIMQSYYFFTSNYYFPSEMVGKTGQHWVLAICHQVVKEQNYPLKIKLNEYAFKKQNSSDIFQSQFFVFECIISLHYDSYILFILQPMTTLPMMLSLCSIQSLPVKKKSRWL